MNDLFVRSNAPEFVVLKALLLFVTVVIAFRFAHRRALSDLSIIDVVVAVAIGSIIGRVPSAADSSFMQGAVTIVVLLGAHTLLTELRFLPFARRWIERPPLVLISEGEIDSRALHRSGLTDDDLRAVLRQHGAPTLAEIRLLVLEARGRTSLHRRHRPEM